MSEKHYNSTIIDCRHHLGVVEHVESPIGKMNTPSRKEFHITPINKFVTLVPLPPSQLQH